MRWCVVVRSAAATSACRWVFGRSLLLAQQTHERLGTTMTEACAARRQPT